MLAERNIDSSRVFVRGFYSGDVKQKGEAAVVETVDVAMLNIEEAFQQYIGIYRNTLAIPEGIDPAEVEQTMKDVLNDLMRGERYD